jgi:restriction system protein
MPRRKNSWADNLVLAPWWMSAALALLVFIILVSVLPATVANSVLVIGITFMLLMISALSVFRSLRSRWVLEAQTGLNSLRDLPWKRFEDVLAEA